MSMSGYPPLGNSGFLISNLSKVISELAGFCSSQVFRDFLFHQYNLQLLNSRECKVIVTSGSVGYKNTPFGSQC